MSLNSLSLVSVKTVLEKALERYVADGNNTVITDYEKTDVTFKKITEKEITDYVNTNDPMDKAGSYSIQGIASSFVEFLDGDYNNVVGLPIYKLSKYLYNSFNRKGDK